MSKIRFELNRAGVRELMKSPEMMTVLKECANTAHGKLGEGYAVGTFVESTRACARISAVTQDARRENAENNTLLKALGL